MIAAIGSTVRRTPRRASPTGRVRRAAGVMAVVLLAAVVTGCGGSDDDAGGSDGSLVAPATVEATDPSPTTTAVEPLVPSDDPVELASDTYVAGYPLVVSTRTFQRLGGLLGVNSLLWQSSLSGAASRIIVAPNRDTLYSVAVLDLRGEPMVLTLPEITDRYVTYQLLDAWTDSFAYIGTRATGGRAGTWAIVPPGWEGELPAGVERIDAPTPQVFLLGRLLVDDEADVANVTAISREASLEPLSSLTGDEPAPPPPPLGEPAGSPQDIPDDASFYPELADALAVNPPTTEAQRALFAAAADELGVEAGATPGPTEVLDAGAADGAARIAAGTEQRSETVGGWTVALDIGTYGDDIVRRAVVARVGWGANVPEEAVYPVARTDSDGQQLTGAHTYRIRIPADELPPVDAFWSLSAYGPDLFFAEHPSGRYTIGDRSPDLTFAEDGSLEIVLAHDEPAEVTAGEDVSWLPVPSGPFVLMLRLYLPDEAVISGEWAPPPIERDA